MSQKNRIKIFAILFLATGIGALLVLLKDIDFGSDENPSQKIAVDSVSLSKITLTYKATTTILKKGKPNWTVNDKFRARQNLINLMIVGLTKAEIKRPVAAENKSKIAELLIQKGIKVMVESDGKNTIFYIAPNENDSNSSYYLEEGKTEPYIIYVPGFSGDMTNLFSMDEAGWRNRELYSSTPMSLQKIAVYYPKFKDKSVEIVWNADKTFTIKGITTIDSTKVITYLTQFEFVNVDGYVYDNKETIMAALRKKEPQAIIDVADLNPASNHKLSIYEESKEPKGIYAIVEPENELVIMKPEVLFRLLVRKEFFEKKK